ncbi:HAD family hydrolase [Fictibacillus enclensis]|uniref:HAD family hydrolase n=1 Tax=Fictibacillus enclensis TaxID=1017270 RepID=UPI0024BF4121|nr:HAD family hydrolase [Fictibacillus enclensis]MDM5336911.1 HAD family hydrolase [Fictibacillus enclensis]WHY73332.1 HAD family hydrolase [Fictibacillus enclensis]
MRDLIENSELLIFDLDGTLYEDTDHFDYYCRLLQQRADRGIQEEFYGAYEKMKKGLHPVAVGKVYDLKLDMALTVDPLTLQVTAAHHWDGSPMEEETLKREYPGELLYDFERFIAIGDGWWLPYVTAMHYGLTQQDTWDAYNATKLYMVSDEFSLSKTPGLKESLERLKKDKYLVLMTNSEEDDVLRLLKELGLDGLFHAIYPSTQKPVKTKEVLSEILAKWKIAPEKAVSIGDNFINEIAPALLMGLNAVYIQPNGYQLQHDNLTVVPTLADAF